MKKSIEQRFIDFKKRHNLSNEIITKMITDYATSRPEFARTYFSNEYNISIHTFYKARDYAVIFGLVDNEICKKLRIKTAENYKNNNKNNSAKATLEHFYYLMSEREKFFSRFTESEIQDIGRKYIEGVSVKKIAIAYNVGEYAIKYLLAKGVVELIFDGDMVKALIRMRGSQLNGILQKREANKRALLDCLTSEINFLTQQTKCYNAYIRFSKDNFSKEDVDRRLRDAMDMYNKALQL